jgi:hypothetical protein
MTQFDKTRKGRMIIKNPDLSFCNFLISTIMFSLSVVTFYGHRDFNNEYFNRLLITNNLERNTLGYQNFNDIKSVEDLKYFMNETIAN